MSTIFLGRQDFVEIGPEQLHELKRAARNDGQRRARLCLHRDHSDKVQQMVIAVCNDSYIHPHRQKGKRKSYYLIEGECCIVFFGEEGTMTRTVEMGPAGKGKPFLYGFAGNLWHTVVSRTEVAVYIETTSGPFVKEETDWAPWAPTNQDVEKAAEYLRELKEVVGDF